MIAALGYKSPALGCVMVIAPTRWPKRILISLSLSRACAIGCVAPLVLKPAIFELTIKEGSSMHATKGGELLTRNMMRRVRNDCFKYFTKEVNASPSELSLMQIRRSSNQHDSN